MATLEVSNMDINLFDYYLPEELIAQSPKEKRDTCKLMVCNRETKTIEHKIFHDIIDYLKPGDVLVRNNTKVIPARLLGAKKETGGAVEVLLLKQLENDTWECLVGNARSVKVGTHCVFGNGELVCECVNVKDEGIRDMKFIYKGIFMEILEQLGQMPLPPYIKKQCSNNDDYQTVYAKVPGSAAAPTAGFHFTKELFEEIRAKGVEVEDITLNIGLGTFRPVKVQDTKDHVMHSEVIEMSEEVAARLNKAKKEGRRIIAIGTTSIRTLESIYGKYGEFKATREPTRLYIEPGYTFKAVDAIITNFHLPKSTLVELISSFAGRSFILSAYDEAVKEKYRFFSFGDAMFIYGDNFDYSKAID